MREIKFRGKAVNREGYHRTNYKNNDWVYGLLTKHKFVFDDNHNLNAEMRNEDGVEGIEVDENTLGQYTGVKDKNGVEIYEGDIVRTKYKEFRDFGDEKADYFTSFVEEVVWLPVLNGFGLVYHIEDIPVYRPLNYITNIREVKLIEVEVIGNIYDNIELLKEIYK